MQGTSSALALPHKTNRLFCLHQVVGFGRGGAKRRHGGFLAIQRAIELLPAGQKLEQSDLDQFPPGAPGSECMTCMYWWNDGITVELPKLS